MAATKELHLVENSAASKAAHLVDWSAVLKAVRMAVSTVLKTVAYLVAWTAA